MWVAQGSRPPRPISGLAPWSITTRRSGCRSSSRRRFGRCGGRTSASKTRSDAAIARRPGASAGPSIQSTSGMSWSIGRRPFRRGCPGELGDDVGRVGRVERRPADDARHDGRRRGELEQEARLGHRRRRLDEHGGVDPGAGEQRRQIGRLEVPVDGSLGRGEPAVVGPREPPEVLVGVDAPRSAPRHPGVGASGRTRPSVFRSRQSAGGIGGAEEAEVLLDLGRAPGRRG